MENLTISEFYEELEKSDDINFKELVNKNLGNVEYLISRHGELLGYNLGLATKNMGFYLEERIYIPNLLIKGALFGKGNIGSNSASKGDKREFQFRVAGELEQELWSIVKKSFIESGLAVSC